MSKTILGAVKLVGLPESFCFESQEQFMQQYADMLRVEIPEGNISNVIISNQQPGADDIGALWIRRANSGEVLGAYVFSTDRWVQLFPAPSEVFVLTGISTQPPAGYKALTSGDLGLTSDQVTAIYTRLGLETSTGSGVYYLYPAIFIGV